MANDELKHQRQAFDFFREHFREDKPFTKADLQQKTQWSEKSISTYWSKRFEPFLKPVPPILRGSSQKDHAKQVSWFFHRLFVEDVIEVAGEAEIWMIESGLGNPRLHIWRGKEEDD